jgi:type 1 fimbria pilin
MKKQFSLLTAALLLSGTSSAFASTADLTVTGKITPSACSPTLAQSEIDFGPISVSQLDPDNATEVGQRSVQLNVACDAATSYALTLVDNKPGTALHDGLYGLGLINGEQKLGGYDLVYFNPITENGTPTLLVSNDQAATWVNYTGGGFAPGSWAGFGGNTGGDWSPTKAQTLDVGMQISAFIAPAKDLDLSNEVTLDGFSTLEVKYL